MDKIIIDSTTKSNIISINKDSYVLIQSEVQTKEINLNIIDCKVKIIDLSNTTNKTINFKNSEGTIIEVINDKEIKEVQINNNNSKIEYNIIDLLDENITYSVNENSNSEASETSINIASVAYKNKNKDYKISTSNLYPYTTNYVNCFGIVKDKSVLNYDVSSFIKNGARKSIVKQSSSILLFDKESQGKNSPILLIEENDVKASHGSSIGKIDDDTMFYLCSRGLSKNEATYLICLGKVQNIINKIDDKDIKETLVNKFIERMS